MKLKFSKSLGIIIAAIVALVFIAAIATVFLLNPKPEEPEEAPVNIITQSALESVIQVSDFSTFSATYNGIAMVMNEDDPEEVDYYVSYEAEIKAGINFDDLEYDIDDSAQIIRITLPDIQLWEPDVEITSLDYIFMNDDANTSTVTEEAYRACKEDAEDECENEEEIRDRARENAKRALEALTEPLLQSHPGYELEVV